MPVPGNGLVLHRNGPSPRPSGTALALASLLGGAVAAGLAMLLTPETGRLTRTRPAGASAGSEPDSRAQAEEAIQRTLEGRCF
jgi:hypothetical protein